MAGDIIGFVYDRKTDVMVGYSDWREFNKVKIAKKTPK